MFVFVSCVLVCDYLVCVYVFIYYHFTFYYYLLWHLLLFTMSFVYKNIVVLPFGWKTVKTGSTLHIWWKVCAIFSSFMTRGYQLVIKYEGWRRPVMNGEELLQLFIFHSYSMELQGKTIFFYWRFYGKNI